MNLSNGPKSRNNEMKLMSVHNTHTHKINCMNVFTSNFSVNKMVVLQFFWVILIEVNGCSEIDLRGNLEWILV